MGKLPSGPAAVREHVHTRGCWQRSVPSAWHLQERECDRADDCLQFLATLTSQESLHLVSAVE